MRSARDVVRTALAPVAPANSELVETAALLTSEVVTNAVTTSVGITWRAPDALYAPWTTSGAVLSVQDRAPGVPQVPDECPPLEREHGRGLLLIALYAAEWGICHHTPGPGKVVWFRLSA